MSRKKNHNNEISSRIIKLASLEGTNKAFIEKCGIRNHSLITDLKKGTIKTPGAEILEKIILGTGCSANWLLTGRGEMFPEEEKSRVNNRETKREEKNKKRPSSKALIEEGEEILARLEAMMGSEAGAQASESGGAGSAGLPADVRRKLLELLLLDELRRE